MPRSGTGVFPERLAQAMRFQDISAGELAERIGVSRMTIHAWRSGKSSPTVMRLMRLSDELGVTTAYLLGNEKPLNIPAPYAKYQRSLLATEGINREEMEQKFDDFREFLNYLRNRTKRPRVN
jgi:transcriptional regulator with XRE-family HTH domain